MSGDDAEDDEKIDFEPGTLEAIGPDGRVYRIVAVRRGRSLNPSGDAGFDLTTFVMGIVLDIAVALNASRFHGWKVGVVSPRSPLIGGGVQYEELVEGRDRVEARMHEVAALVALHGPKLT